MIAMKRTLTLLALAATALLSLVSCRQDNIPQVTTLKHIVSDLVVEAGDHCVTLSWTMKEGWNPQDYKVSWLDAESVAQAVFTGGKTSCTIENLLNGYYYQFSVQAVYEGGSLSGPISAMAMPQSPFEAPLSFSAVGGNQYVRLAWDAPEALGVRGYRIEYVRSDEEETANPTVVEATAEDRTKTIEGLTNGISYTFRIQAIYEEGKSEFLSLIATPSDSGDDPGPQPTTHFSGGEGTATSPYLIAKADDFRELISLCSADETAAQFAAAGVCYQQTADIDFSGATLAPVTGYNTQSYPFRGTYDGNNKTLSNFSIASDLAYVGLFGYCVNATLKNIKLNSVTFSGTSTTMSGLGGIAGYASGTTISGCVVTGITCSGKACVGGIVGRAYGTTTISGCSVQVTKMTSTGGSNFGGIVGLAANNDAAVVTVSNCSTTGTINPGTGTVGGIIGYLHGSKVTVSNCNNGAAVVSTGHAGGIVASMVPADAGGGSVITTCRNTGNVTNSSETNGAGGICGLVQGGTIKLCYSKATIKGGFCAGGIAGYLQGTKGTILLLNSTARSTVISTLTGDKESPAGGIAGIVYSNPQQVVVANCVAWDMVVKNLNTASPNTPCVGGIVGKMSVSSSSTVAKALVQNCYAQQADSNIGVGIDNTEAPTTTMGDCKLAGGICGKAASGTLKDCYCRNSKVTGTKGSSFVITNGIIVDKAVKNGTANFSPTLSNGRSLSNVKLFNALTQGSYSGSSGTTALTFTSAAGTAEALSTWTTYESGENAFALPTPIFDLGTTYYK